MLIAFTNPIKEAIIKNTVENYAEKVLGQDYGTMGFWVALAMVVVYIPLLGRLAAAHFFGRQAHRLLHIFSNSNICLMWNQQI